MRNQKDLIWYAALPKRKIFSTTNRDEHLERPRKKQQAAGAKYLRQPVVQLVQAAFSTALALPQWSMREPGRPPPAPAGRKQVRRYSGRV